LSKVLISPRHKYIEGRAGAPAGAAEAPLSENEVIRSALEVANALSTSTAAASARHPPRHQAANIIVDPRTGVVGGLWPGRRPSAVEPVMMAGKTVAAGSWLHTARAMANAAVPKSDIYAWSDDAHLLTARIRTGSRRFRSWIWLMRSFSTSSPAGAPSRLSPR